MKAHPGINGIILFAASKAVGESVQQPLKYYRNNVVTLVNLLELMPEFNIEGIVFSSSCTVYGQPDPEKMCIRDRSKHKKVTLSANLAPLSYTYVRTLDKDIDLGRHFQKRDGEEEFPYKQSLFGSTVNATMTFQFSRNIIWYSRFYYMTDYKRIQGEFENRLNMAISRFFSTIISLNLRYDDGISKHEDFDSYLQINELLSFGFNYKW